MNDETTSGQPEGEALPASRAERLAQRIERDALSLEQRLAAAIERWYAAHFHAAAVAGVAPITADDKAALIQHVADAVAPAATQEK